MASKARLGTGKVCSAEQAVELIPSGACFTVSGTIGWMYPAKLLRALEVRFLSTGAPAGLTWFDPFPTGVPGIEPLSYPGLLKRVVGGWFTPHPRLIELINANQVEAYLFPLGTLSFLCQQAAAGRKGLLTQVGLETYLDPRQGGGKLNGCTTEELVSLVELAGEEHLWYKAFPIDVAILRGTVVDEAGNLSLADEAVTMNVLSQALAAKASGGVVIVQAQRLVAEGTIPTREVVIPGLLVDAIVLDPEQHLDEMSPQLDWMRVGDRFERPPAPVLATANKEAWRTWLFEREILSECATAGAGEVPAPPVLEVRPLTADIIIARRAVYELHPGELVNIGQGLPARDIMPVTIEEGLDRVCELSVETGHTGGIHNGLGFRSNATCILDTPAIFSLYSAGIPSATFLSMLEFDRQGNINLLRHGTTWVGPGGSMDIGHSVQKIIFCGTFRAGGLQATGIDGRLLLQTEGRVPRAVEAVQAICFNGRRMWEAGKEILYVTERAVFRLEDDGPTLIEVAPGIDLERDVIAEMGFRPRISPRLREMDARIFRPGWMGVYQGRQSGDAEQPEKVPERLAATAAGPAGS